MTSSARFLRRTVWEAMTPEQMIERYRAGASLDDIGMLTGSSAYKVRKILVAHGVTIKPSCRTSGPNPSRFVVKSK